MHNNFLVLEMSKAPVISPIKNGFSAVVMACKKKKLDRCEIYETFLTLSNNIIFSEVVG